MGRRRAAVKGREACGFDLTYAPWDAAGRKVRERRTTTLRAGSNLSRIQGSIDSVTPGEIVVGIGLAKRNGDGRVHRDKDRGILGCWQPPEKSGTIGVSVVVDPSPSWATPRTI